MKCENCLGQLETGGRFARWRARRHVAKCARCATEFAAWNLFRNAMQASEPLTEGQKNIWMRATTATDVETIITIETSKAPPDARRSEHWQMTVLAASVLVCVLLFINSPARKPNVAPQLGGPPHGQSDSIELPVPQVTKTIVIPIQLAEELEQLDSQIVVTLQQIERLKQQIERHEVSQRIDALVVLHSRW